MVIPALLCGVLIASAVCCAADGDSANDATATLSRAERIKRLDVTVLDHIDEASKRRWEYMWPDDAEARLAEINRRSTATWRRIDSRAAWEQQRDLAIAALRAAHGPRPVKLTGDDAKVYTTATIPGDGFVVRNVVFASAPGLAVPANIYVPDPPRASMPGIVIVHSHHEPKSQTELQVMGMTFARLGCVVIVPELLSHGERRQHPFATESDYDGPFRLSRQDYYFRYNAGIQLHLIGDSLMSWFVRDLSRCVDVLLEHPGVDAKRIIMMGAVAGGGDPVAVTAALDERIACAVPFNFGGPQPESRYPLPDDAEESFAYAGSGSWESTRNLSRSAADGFLPWVIVGSIAPRRLIYAHEFSWDRLHDPVYKRFERIWGAWYHEPDRLASAQGFGTLKLRGDKASHCTNIGPPHRSFIYPALHRWFDIPEPETEYSQPLEAARLDCMTDDIAQRLGAKPLNELTAAISDGFKRPADVRTAWSQLLGEIRTIAPATIETRSTDTETLPGVTLERVALRIERGIVVPLVLMIPKHTDGKRPPVVLGLAQDGKSWFSQLRNGTITALLDAGVAVCLPDLRGTGETQPGQGDNRTRRSWDTAVSSSEMMLGDPTLAGRLRDTFAIIDWLRRRDDLDGKRLALWGDNFAPVNRPHVVLRMPLALSHLPYQCEPAGDILALLAAMFDDNISAVYLHNNLLGYRSVLDSWMMYVPHDIIVPGALTAGDLRDIAATIAPRPLLMRGCVDALNRRVDAERVNRVYTPTIDAYKQAHASDALRIDAEAEETDDPATVATWLTQRLQ